MLCQCSFNQTKSESFSPRSAPLFASIFSEIAVFEAVRAVYSSPASPVSWAFVMKRIARNHFCVIDLGEYCDTFREAVLDISDKPERFFRFTTSLYSQKAAKSIRVRAGSR